MFSEGWGLYAEQLAEEAGLYSDDRALLGSVSSSLMRAVRLVVDTGLHAFGWSRERALEFAVAHVPMSPDVLAAEIDRYVVMPGQALSYLTGKLEILRIRAEAERRLGAAFSLPAFHAAVLDHGSLPMPALARSITGWLDRSAGRRPEIAGLTTRGQSGIAARICCSVRGSVRTRTPRASYRALPMAAAVGPCAVSPTPSDGFPWPGTNSTSTAGTSEKRRIG